MRAPSSEARSWSARPSTHAGRARPRAQGAAGASGRLGSDHAPPRHRSGHAPHTRRPPDYCTELPAPALSDVRRTRLSSWASTNTLAEFFWGSHEELSRQTTWQVHWRGEAGRACEARAGSACARWDGILRQTDGRVLLCRLRRWSRTRGWEHEARAELQRPAPPPPRVYEPRARPQRGGRAASGMGSLRPPPGCMSLGLRQQRVRGPRASSGAGRGARPPRSAGQPRCPTAPRTPSGL